MTIITICPKCGTENNVYAVNCMKCRVNLQWALENAEEFIKSSQIYTTDSIIDEIMEVRFPPLIGAAISAVSGIGIMVFFFLMFNGGKFELDLIKIALILGSIMGFFGGLFLSQRRKGEWSIVSSVAGGLLAPIILLYFIVMSAMENDS